MSLDDTFCDSALARLRELHERIRLAVTGDRVYATTPVTDAGADVAFAPDVDAEAVIDSFCREWATHAGPFRVVTEEHERVYPDDAPPQSARFRLIIDPIDGTRVFLRGLRSAWTLSAIAPEHDDGSEPCLMDAVVVLQSEIPTPKQDLIDVLSLRAGSAPQIERVSVRTGDTVGCGPLAASDPDTIDHAFVVFSKFFPEGKTIIAGLEEAVCARLDRGRERAAGRAYFFDDQYMSTGGQFYCLATGAYAVAADVRPLLDPLLARRGEARGLAAHPYDLATLRLAASAGVRFTDLRGNDLDIPMNNHEAVGFIGYAGDRMRARIEPILLDELTRIERFDTHGDRSTRDG